MPTTKYIDIKLRTKSAETSADKLDGKMKGLGTTVDKTSNSFGVLSKVAAAVGTAIVTGQITKYADAWTNVNNRLRAATSTNEEFLISQKGVISIAQEAGVGLSGVADSYSRIAQNTEHLGLSQDRVLDITRKLTLAIKAGGATSQEAASTLVQFGQGLGTNALQGEELKAIMEASIPVTKALAKEFGVTTGELKKLGSEGKLTADRVVSAIENMDKKSLTFTKDISDGFTELTNALTVYVGGVDESVGITKAIGGALSSLSRNIDLAANGAVVFASVFAARLIPSLTSYTLGLYNNSVAQITQEKAVIRVGAATNITTAAYGRAIIATRALTVASRAATGAMTFLGGPLGIALIAATALYTFGDSVTDLNRKVSTATPEMDAFAASIEKMSRGAKGASLANINNEMTKLRATLTETQAKLDGIKVQNNGGLYDRSTIEAANYRVKIKELNDELELLSQKQGIIVGAPDLSGGTNRGDINNEQPNAAPTATAQSQYSINLAQETEALQIELALRQQVEQGYLSQHDADLSASYLIGESRRALAFENELLKIGENQLLKDELQAQFDEVALLRKQEFEDALTGIKQEATDDRLQIEQDAANAENQMRANVTNNAIGLLQVLGRENKAAAIAGIIISKAMALSANAVATASGATLAFAAQQVPGDPTSFVRGAAAAAKVNALGAVNAGLIVATGLGQAASVFSGGSGSLGLTEQGTGSYSQPVQSEATPVKTRTVDIRTDGSAFSEAVKDAALVLFNGGDDDVVLNITNAQNELIRTSGAG